MKKRLPEVWFLTAVRPTNHELTFLAVFETNPTPDEVLRKVNELEKDDAKFHDVIDGAVVLALPFGGDLTIQETGDCWAAMLAAAGMTQANARALVPQMAESLLKMMDRGKGRPKHEH